MSQEEVHYLSLKISHRIRVPFKKGNMDTIEDGKEGNERNNVL